MTQFILFKDVRKHALDYWITQTGRSIETYGHKVKIDTFENGFECNWQSMAQELKNNDQWHISYFCSLGDWASNISDLLLDRRYDSLRLSDPNSEDAKILFRYYTRILLVVSELLVDFKDIAETLHLNSQLFENKEYSLFINSVCKHKAGKPKGLGKASHKLHTCNHHLPILFEDSNLTSTFISPLQLPINNEIDEPDGIIMPKLNAIISEVVRRYQYLDQQLVRDKNLFDRFPDGSAKILRD